MIRGLVDLRHGSRNPISFANRLRAKHRARRWVLRELARLDHDRKTEKDEHEHGIASD